MDELLLRLRTVPELRVLCDLRSLALATVNIVSSSFLYIKYSNVPKILTLPNTINPISIRPRSMLNVYPYFYRSSNFFCQRLRVEGAMGMMGMSGNSWIGFRRRNLFGLILSTQPERW
jgi:hypothetical protein